MKFNAQELAEAPKITIAGKEWPVPPLSPKQNRRIVPRLQRMSKFTNREALTSITEEDMDAMYDVIYWALTRANPDLEYKDFVEWAIPMHELREALPVIARQTGVMKVGAPESGEAKGESPSTGTSSSQE